MDRGLDYAHAGGTMLLSGTGLGASTRNQLLVTAAPALNSGVLKGAVMTTDSGATYNLVSHNGTASTSVYAYAGYTTGAQPIGAPPP